MHFEIGGKNLKDYIEAHKHCTNHKNSLSNDDLCGCFYCLEIFSPKEITEWIGDKEGSAMCPYCGIDSVIGESSGYPITKKLLKRMSEYWFDDIGLKLKAQREIIEK